MSWSRHQIITVQIYRRYARLQDQEYRFLLKTHTGTTSSRDPGLTNWRFDGFMAALEARLEREIEEGVVPAPAGVKLGYWRARLPKGGAANSRYLARIEALWTELCPLLPLQSRTPEYLAGIATHACGYRVREMHDVKAWQARLVIDALRDRLQYALKHAGAQSAGEPALAVSPAPSARCPMDTSSLAPVAPRDVRPENVPIGHSQGVRGAETAPPAAQDHVTAGGNVGAEELPF